MNNITRIAVLACFVIIFFSCENGGKTQTEKIPEAVDKSEFLPGTNDLPVYDEVFLLDEQIAEKENVPSGDVVIDFTPTGKEAYTRVVSRFTFAENGKRVRIVMDIWSNEMMRQKDYWEKLDYMDYCDLIGETNKGKYDLYGTNNNAKVAELNEKMYAAIMASQDDLARQISREIDSLMPIQYDGYRTYLLKYRYIYRYCESFFKRLVKGLETFFAKEGFSKEQSMQFVIGWVQSITYLQPTTDASGGYFAPAQVLATLTGDCDSKTMLLYGILRTMGYDMAIIHSGEYNHVMSGINLPASGAFMTCQGKKYYFVESITPGSEIGEIRKEWSNLSNWNITN